MATRVAVIGLGKMGIMHSAVVSTHPEAQIVAVVDSQPQLAHYARSLGLEAPFYTSVEQMLDSTSVDAVVVCTPAATHFPIAAVCIERGVHVFVEKPLADTLENARKMCALVEDAPLVHAVGYMKAHYPLYQKMRALLQAGTLGRIHQCHCSVYLSQVFRPPTGWVYRKDLSGGGIIINSTCHLLFLLQWCFGKVGGVFARAHSIHSAVEDAAMVVLEFENGIVASIGTSWAVPGYPVEHTEIQVIAERGSLHITDDAARVFLTQDGGEYRKGWSTIHRSEVDRAAVDLSPDYGGEGYSNEDFEFIDCCTTGRKPLVSWQEGLKVQEIIDAIYRSAGEGYVTL